MCSKKIAQLYIIVAMFTFLNIFSSHCLPQDRFFKIWLNSGFKSTEMLSKGSLEMVRESRGDGSRQIIDYDSSYRDLKHDVIIKTPSEDCLHIGDVSINGVVTDNILLLDQYLGTNPSKENIEETLNSTPNLFINMPMIHLPEQGLNISPLFQFVSMSYSDLEGPVITAKSINCNCSQSNGEASNALLSCPHPKEIIVKIQVTLENNIRSIQIMTPHGLISVDFPPNEAQYKAFTVGSRNDVRMLTVMMMSLMATVSGNTPKE